MNSKKAQNNELLTKRELEIVKLLIDGLASKQIASTLNISINTVNTHRRNIIKRAGTKNVLEAAFKLVKIGII